MTLGSETIASTRRARHSRELAHKPAGCRPLRRPTWAGTKARGGGSKKDRRPRKGVTGKGDRTSTTVTLRGPSSALKVTSKWLHDRYPAFGIHPFGGR